jgi:hypothetical protein
MMIPYLFNANSLTCHKHSANIKFQFKGTRALKQTMTAKVDAAPAPAKLSPGERLARKRRAARMRQQRCRSRKREVMLEERRHNTDGKRTEQSQESREPHDHQRVFRYPSERPPLLTSRSGETEYWGENIGTTGPIHNCVSFESQRSFEESQKPHEKTQSPGSPSGKQNQSAIAVLSPAAASSAAPKESSRSSEQGKGPATMSEEAAVAAMLSLKTGPDESSSNKSSTSYRYDSQFRGHGVKVSWAAKHRYFRTWGPRQFRPYYEHSRPIRVLEYRPIPPPPPPMQRYPYYPGYERYERFRYE